MEWVSLILNFAASIGLVGSLFFYKSKRIEARANAFAAELNNIDKIIAQKDGYIEDLKNQQQELKREKEALREESASARSSEAKERDKVVNLYKKLSEVNISNVKKDEQIALLRYHRCEMVHCDRRKPPRSVPPDRREERAG